MRTLSILAALFGSLAVASALPSNVCSPEKVALELRPLGTARAQTNTGVLADYQLAFQAIDHKAANNRADFIDIHYRSAERPAMQHSLGVSLDLTRR